MWKLSVRCRSSDHPNTIGPLTRLSVPTGHHTEKPWNLAHCPTRSKPARTRERARSGKSARCKCDSAQLGRRTRNTLTTWHFTLGHIIYGGVVVEAFAFCFGRSWVRIQCFENIYISIKKGFHDELIYEGKEISSHLHSKLARFFRIKELALHMLSDSQDTSACPNL